MELHGYKCFNKDLTNRYGMKFEVGKEYKVSGDIEFGVDGNGFHICENVEDTFRYFDAMNDEVKVCFVKGSGEIIECADDYYGYYGLYSVEKLEIIKLLSRNEIINLGLNLGDERVKRFLSLFKLEDEEKKLFINKYIKCRDILDTISYYQDNDVKTYTKKK